MAQRRYYLSEMAVSNKHGGGLTLQRILQDDLKHFDNFFHVHEFATKNPIIDELKAKQVNLHQLYPYDDSETWSKRIGSLRDRLIRKLRLQSYLETTWDARIRNFADHMLKNFNLSDSSWLVVPQNIPSLRVMHRVFRAKRVNYMTWIMDDHVVQWKTDKDWYYPRGFEEEFACHLGNASKVFVISPEMARFYGKRFGVDSEVLFGPTDPIALPVYQSPDPSGPVRLCYFGALLEWQKDTLDHLASKLASLTATLDIFSFHDVPPSLLNSNVRVLPPVSSEHVISRMREYDGVLITISYKDDSRNMTELNISTKMSECLASGTVTVIIGPESAAMVQFARLHMCSLVVTDLEDPKQIARIRDLKKDTFRQQVLNQASYTSATFCSVESMRTIWRKYWN
jgi:hypothetical protein